jgi:hypothetical protein
MTTWTKERMTMPDPTGLKTRLPTELLTGDARIDDHLDQLDRALVGTARVRRPVVQELRDFLLDAKDAALRDGRDADAAVDDAISAAGTVDEIAGDQRAAKRREFLRIVRLTGLPWGLWMTVFMGIYFWSEFGRLSISQIGVLIAGMSIAGLLFGALMGALVYIAVPGTVSLPSTRPDSEFVVELSRPGRRWLYALTVFATLLIGLPAASLTGYGFDWPAALSTLLLLMNVPMVIFIVRYRWFRATVAGDRLRMVGVSGGIEISRGEILGLERPTMLRRWLNMAPAGDACDLVWRGEDGRTRRRVLPLTPDMIDSDRLRAWIEAALPDPAVKESSRSDSRRDIVEP